MPFILFKVVWCPFPPLGIPSRGKQDAQFHRHAPHQWDGISSSSPIRYQDPPAQSDLPRRLPVEAEAPEEDADNKWVFDTGFWNISSSPPAWHGPRTGEPTGESKWDSGTDEQSFHFETKSTQCPSCISLSRNHNVSSRGAQHMEVNVIFWSPSYPNTRSIRLLFLSPPPHSSPGLFFQAPPPLPCHCVPAAGL